MARISLNSNLFALNAQRRFAESSSSLSKSFERLSSGLRINRASDDAAGLAISSSLRVDSRVYSQAIRNANDGISVLGIAESAVRELSSVVMRLQELATAAANGSVSLEQRKSLDQEGVALVEEYNRIVGSTKFNDLHLTDGSLQNLSVQLGYGELAQIAVSIADELSRLVGSGTFGSSLEFANNSDTSGMTVGDFNGDGIADVAHAADSVHIYLGNGDGTFRISASYAGSVDARSLAVGDINSDGIDDIAVGTGSDNYYILLGNGDGSFQTSYSFAAPSSNTVVSDLRLADLDGDGTLDLIAQLTANGGNNGGIYVAKGNGDSTFQPGDTYDLTPIPNSDFENFALADFNGDGVWDTVSSSYNREQVSILFGNTDGSFSSALSISISSDNGIVAHDFNFDGYADFATSSGGAGGSLQVFLSNGDGSFKGPVSYAFASQTGVIGEMKGADMNGDGILDIVTQSTLNDLQVFYGNADGSFATSVTIGNGSGTDTTGMELVDIDNDGVNDIVSTTFGDGVLGVRLQESKSTVEIGRLYLLTQDGALETLDELETIAERVSRELGAIGSTQSRLAVALQNLQQGRENIDAAESRIVDVDVARESAQLVRSQILQQAGAAVLTQANLIPQLALQLLG